MALTDKQRFFAREYLRDLNATQAAIRAGYSENTASEQGSRLLGNVKVATYISKLKKDRGARLDITADRVLEELAKIGFADIRKAMTWNGDKVRFVPSDELDDDTAGAIVAVESESKSFTDKDGNTEETVRLKLRLADKRAALVDIGKHLGMFEPTTDDDNATTAEDLASLLRTAVRATAPSAGPSDAGTALEQPGTT